MIEFSRNHFAAMPHNARIEAFRLTLVVDFMPP